MKPVIVLAGLVALLLLAPATEARRLRITHVNVIDGTGRPVSADMSILIRDGRIVDISRSRPRGGEEVLDGRGAYALPGLIDAHTHLASVPGSVYRKDSAETRDCLWKFHMHAYVAAGVTTVLDNAASYGFVEKLHAYAAAGGIGPRTYYLAPLLTPSDGYFSDASLRKESYADLWSPVASRTDLIAHLERAAELKPVGIKVVIENGFGPVAVWDIFSTEMRNAIREEARKRGMPLFIHSMSNDAHRKALGMRPHTLVHSLFSDDQPDPDVVKAMKEKGVFVVSTIAVYDFLQVQWRQSDLNAPLVGLTVPDIEIATASDGTAWKEQNEAVAAVNSPDWLPTFLVRWGLSWFYSKEILAEYLDSAKRNLKQLYDAGIPIVMGSDSGNWPVFLSAFHGPGTIREMELIVQAGIPPMEAVQAATQRAARMIGVEDELGTLEVGKLADLILVASNPLDNMRALRRIDWVIQGGVARRPHEWMASASRCP